MTFLQDQKAPKINTQSMIEIGFQNKEQVDHICKKIISEGLSIYQLQVIKHNLEQMFLEMTKN